MTDTDVDALMLDPEKLSYKDTPLAVKVVLESPLQKALGSGNKS